MIAKDQFVDALLDFDMRLRIKQSRPKSLNDDVRLAVEIETLCIAERSDNSNNTDARHVSGFPLKCNHCGRRWHEIKDCFMRSNQKKTVNLKQVNIAKPSSRTKDMIRTSKRTLQLVQNLLCLLTRLWTRLRATC